MDTSVVPFYQAMCLKQQIRKTQKPDGTFTFGGYDNDPSEATWGLCQGLLRNKDKTIEHCETLGETYGYGEKSATLAASHNYLLSMFKQMPETATFGEYQEYVACGEKLYENLPLPPNNEFGNGIRVYGSKNTPNKNKLQSVYYAFEYNLYEIPFSWWFKCVFLGGLDGTSLGWFENPTSSTKPLQCSAYSNSFIMGTYS